MAPKINDFGKEELFKDVVEDVANLKSDLRQPDKFASIFCEAAKTQKSIDSALKDLVTNLLKNDVAVKESVQNIVEDVDRRYGRLLLGKAGWAIWAIIGMAIQGIVSSYFK
jgi:hypothetical protein